MPDYDSLYFRKHTKKQEIDKAVHTLEGILKGITIDNLVNKKEIKELHAWLSEYQEHSHIHPFKEIIPIISEALKDNVLDNEEINDLLWLCNNLTTKNTYFDIITSDLQRLHGILHGILADNKITIDEVSNLHDWLEENTHLSGCYPYDEIYSILTTVLADGVLSDNENKLLKVVFSDFIDTNITVNISLEEISKLKQEITIGGICAMCPEIDFSGKVFCFTGISSKTKRSTIKDTIESLDGLFKNNVSKQTHYLVIGDEGNPCWAYACYGRKVETAVNLRKDGHYILIVHENDFWDSIEDHLASVKK